MATRNIPLKAGLVVGPIGAVVAGAAFLRSQEPSAQAATAVSESGSTTAATATAPIGTGGAAAVQTATAAATPTATSAAQVAPARNAKKTRAS